jgi:catechol 2,3-dioxygenase
MRHPPDAQLTHVGLYVDDLDRMVEFYTDMVGFIISDRGAFNGRDLAFLSRKSDEHHQLVFVTGRRGEGPIQLLSQISFRVDGLDALRFFRDRATELGATGMEGRNHGNSWSIYFEDPEGNRIEMYTATPWHVRQPWRVALDLEESNETIEQKTLELIQDSADWEPVDLWRNKMALSLGETEPNG